MADSDVACPNCQQLQIELEAADATIARMEARYGPAYFVSEKEPPSLSPSELKRGSKLNSFDFWASMRFDSGWTIALRKAGQDPDEFFQGVFDNIGLGVPDLSHDPYGMGEG